MSKEILEELKKKRLARQVAIAKAYEGGLTLEETGKMFNICRERVRQILVIQGLEHGHMSIDGYVDSDKAAKNLGVHIHTLTKYAKHIGVDLIRVRGRMRLKDEGYIAIVNMLRNRPRCHGCSRPLQVMRKYKNKLQMCAVCYAKRRYMLDPIARAKQDARSRRWFMENYEHASKMQRIYAKRWRLKNMKKGG